LLKKNKISEFILYYKRIENKYSKGQGQIHKRSGINLIHDLVFYMKSHGKGPWTGGLCPRQPGQWLTE
jgi:hypothetical protein